MHNVLIRRVAVLGAGVMGAQIAAHLANAQIEVVLFDLATAPEGGGRDGAAAPAAGQDGAATQGAPGDGAADAGARSAIARHAIDALAKMNPAPLGTPEVARIIRAANYDTDLPLLAGCDLVIEAIAERMDLKHGLYARVAPHLAAHAIFATNTSGLSIGELAAGFDVTLRRRFCGVHFFNPPRYMHLVELIPTAGTDPAIVDALETFLTRTLGKGVLRAKDTPNFIANRVGVFSMLATMHEAGQRGLSFDVVDDLTGERLGRPKSGTYRTIDVVGLDTTAHVIGTMQANVHDAFAALYAVPPVLRALVERGALGQKAGAGFYRKVGRDIQRLDPQRSDYVPSGTKADETVARILKKDWPERLALLRGSTNPQAQFLWAVLRDVFHYAALSLAEIADSARDVDLALRWGFGHREGPFEIWQRAGWTQVAGWIAEDIAAGQALASEPLPQWVTQGPVAERGGVHQPEGSWSASRGAFVPRTALPVYERQVFRAAVYGDGSADPATAGDTVFEDGDVRLWTVPRAGLDDVLVLSTKTKMGVIGPGVVAGLNRGIELAERDYRGLVVWSPRSQTGGPFSAGADLQAAMPVFMKGGAKAIAQSAAELQDTFLRLQDALVPCVAAVSGLALGGGCELLVRCARRVAALESYVGLVEVGIGLIPGGGGLAWGARRAAQENTLAPAAYVLHFIGRYLMNAGTAAVSKSALEARDMGYLRESDPIVFHPDELLFVAVREAQALHDAGWRAPVRVPFAAAGRSVAATVKAQLANMREGGFISAHDHLLGQTITDVITGGDVEAGTPIDDAWVMRLEREAFGRLLGHPKTQERIMGLLQSGRPVRN